MAIGGKPSLQILTERLQRVSGLSGITVATTVKASDDPLEDLCNKLKIGCFRGSEQDVLQRVLGAARTSGADVIVEITGDCTFLDPDIVEESIDAYKKNDVDFVANCVEKPHYPAGMDPLDMIGAKLAFKAQKRVSREHNSKVLVALVGKILYQKSPQSFVTLANEIVATMPRTEPFWGGVPRTEEQMRQLLRYLDKEGPNYRPPPLGFKLNPDQMTIMRERMHA